VQLGYRKWRAPQPAMDNNAPQLKTRRPVCHDARPRQVGYLKQIQAHDITLRSGPAGTGKTYLAVACARRMRSSATT